MSSYEIYAFLNVFFPTYKATFHPAILPNLNKFCLQLTSFLAVLTSPVYKAHCNEVKKVSYPKFYKES